MVIVQDILVSEEIFKERFVCDLNACKGACCWEGDFGAPLEEAELEILAQIREPIRKYLTERGNEELDKQGNYVLDPDDSSPATTLVDDGPCAYMTYSEQGIAQCGIEQAWKDGIIEFQKPISCHLYPIRIIGNPAVNFEGINYDRWDICSAACTNGARLKVPVYQFLKEPLIRKYGEEFFERLEGLAEAVDSSTT